MFNMQSLFIRYTSIRIESHIELMENEKSKERLSILDSITKRLHELINK